MEQDKARGLMRIQESTLALTSNKEVIPQQTINPSFLIPIRTWTFHKHAVMAFRGDGNPQIIIRVYYGGSYASYIGVPGNAPRIVTVANNTVELIADNTDSVNSRVTPTIEILSLDWS
jgi:hypothetical protein